MPTTRTRSIGPDAQGHFGPFGGRFVPETLMAALEELDAAFRKAQRDVRFRSTLRDYLTRYAGRPTPLYPARRLGWSLGDIRVYLKREDLLHTGAHKINNTLGQGLLALRMGKRRLIAETGAGQHGVATATVAALFELECDVYMGATDMRRQALNVSRMELLGARVIPVTSGTQTLKDACNEAIRDWVTNVRTTHYCLGSVVGPHPYPVIVREFQAVIGEETRREILRVEGRLPDYLIACVGGGSNAIGLFHPFRRDPKVTMIGVEAGGSGLQPGRHAATLVKGSLGVLHGARTLVLQDRHGQILDTRSIAPGLDYPGVGPEHAEYQRLGRARYVSVSDREAVEACRLLARTEGILPALEPAHAIAYAAKRARAWSSGTLLVIGLSGRGDKDVETITRALGDHRDGSNSRDL